MKKGLLLIILTLSSNATFSQKSSLKFQIGYGIPISSLNFANAYSYYTPISNSNFYNVYSYSNVTGSLGKGIAIEVGYTYSVAPHISTQLDIGYSFGAETKTSYSVPNTYSSINTSFFGNFLQTAPLIRFDVGEGKIHPYAAIGPMFAFGNMIEGYHENNNGVVTDQEVKYTSSLSIGTKSILGLELTKGNHGFFVQATITNMNYTPEKSEITKYAYNGQDDLSNLAPINKFADFKDSLDPNAIYNPNQPRQELKTDYALSSLAISVGVRLKF